MELGPITWMHLVNYSKKQLAKKQSRVANNTLMPARANKPPLAPAAPTVIPRTQPAKQAPQPSAKPAYPRAPAKQPAKHANVADADGEVDQHCATR